MTGEISYFRKRFLGGFNREDVIDYIEKLAQERNKLQEEKDKAEHRLLILTSELETLRLEIEQARKSEFEDRENKIAAVIAALNTFAGLETTLNNLNEEVFKISERAREEFNKARDNIAELPNILERADKRFAELLTVFEYEENGDGEAKADSHGERASEVLDEDLRTDGDRQAENDPQTENDMQSGDGPHTSW